MENFIGEIRLVSFNTLPRGWAICNGALLPISANQALYSLLGTTYGGNGTTTFALPDLRSRIPVGYGPQYGLGESKGTEQVTLLPDDLPPHTHSGISGTVKTASEAVESNPNGQFMAVGTGQQFAPPPATGTLASNTVQLTVQPAGNGQPHENRQPYQTIYYLIALVGIYPSRA